MLTNSELIGSTIIIEAANEDKKKVHPAVIAGALGVGGAGLGAAGMYGAGKAYKNLALMKNEHDYQNSMLGRNGQVFDDVTGYVGDKLSAASDWGKGLVYPYIMQGGNAIKKLINAPIYDPTVVKESIGLEALSEASYQEKLKKAAVPAAGVAGLAGGAGAMYGLHTRDAIPAEIESGKIDQMMGKGFIPLAPEFFQRPLAQAGIAYNNFWDSFRN